MFVELSIVFQRSLDVRENKPMFGRTNQMWMKYRRLHAGVTVHGVAKGTLGPSFLVIEDILRNTFYMMIP